MIHTESTTRSWLKVWQNGPREILDGADANSSDVMKNCCALSLAITPDILQCGPG